VQEEVHSPHAVDIWKHKEGKYIRIRSCITQKAKTNHDDERASKPLTYPLFMLQVDNNRFEPILWWTKRKVLYSDTWKKHSRVKTPLPLIVQHPNKLLNCKGNQERRDSHTLTDLLILGLHWFCNLHTSSTCLQNNNVKQSMVYQTLVEKNCVKVKLLNIYIHLEFLDFS
jgi:hypothetical protein